MTMHNPAHPGEILKELVIEPLGLSVTEAASRLGVRRTSLSKVLNGRGAVTPEMAVRLEMTFGKPNAAHWLRLQNAYDLWQTRQRSADIHVSPIELLFMAQRNQWINLRRLASGNQTRPQRDGYQQQSDHGEDRRISRLHFKQQPGHQARQGEGSS